MSTRTAPRTGETRWPSQCLSQILAVAVESTCFNYYAGDTWWLRAGFDPDMQHRLYATCCPLRSLCNQCGRRPLVWLIRSIPVTYTLTLTGFSPQCDQPINKPTNQPGDHQLVDAKGEGLAQRAEEQDRDRKATSTFGAQFLTWFSAPHHPTRAV